MTYSDTCPPCGKVFTGDDREALATEVVDHARVAHDHELTREHVLAHLDGDDPHSTDPAGENNHLGLRVLTHDDSEPLWFQDWLVEVRLDGNGTGGRLALFDCLAPRGSATPLHRDAKSQTFVLLEGEMRFWSGTTSFAVKAGTTVFAEPENPFAFRVESETAHLLILAAPSGLEGFFRRAGRPAATRTIPLGPTEPADHAEMAEAAAAGGVTIVGPPPDLHR